MSDDQKKVLRELLRVSIAHGFGCLYPLAPIGIQAGVTEPLYDNNTNTGLLWKYGPHGDGLIFACGNWPDACASIDYDMAHIIENWTHQSAAPTKDTP